MVRVSLLSATIGFIASSCWYQLFAAQFIAFGFLVLFLWTRPYRRSTLNVLQLVGLVLPCVALMNVSTGGWERAALAARAWGHTGGAAGHTWHSMNTSAQPRGGRGVGARGGRGVSKARGQRHARKEVAGAMLQAAAAASSE